MFRIKINKPFTIIIFLYILDNKMNFRLLFLAQQNDFKNFDFAYNYY